MTTPSGRIGALALVLTLLIALAVCGLASRVKVVDAGERMSLRLAVEHRDYCPKCSKTQPLLSRLTDPNRGLPCAGGQYTSGGR